MNQQFKEFGLIHWFYSVLLYPLVSRVRVLSADFEDLAERQKAEQIIFVGNAVSFIDFLIINHLLVRKGLSHLRFTHGMSPFLLKPFGEAFKQWVTDFFKKREVRRQEKLDFLMDQVRQGKHGFVFLKKSAHLSSEVDYYAGFIERVSREVDENSKTIRLVPTSVFLTRQRKKNTPRSSFDILFRTYDFPGRFRKFLQLLLNTRTGGIVLSRHIDLTEERLKTAEMPAKRFAKRIRWSLMFHFSNEDRAYRGPMKRSRNRKVRKILKERKLNQELTEVAQRQGRSIESVRREANRNLHRIASDTSERTLNVLRILSDLVWSRILTGIDFKREDLDRIRELNKKGPVIFLPCHRSHVDYLVVAYIFEKYGLNNPRFAAGDNLAKWPLGAILRRAGAFFIRRSFKGEAVFPLVFQAYIRQILRERNILIFFMEGGRSRTGKLMHPKLGMMGMVLDAWKQGVVEDIPLVPVTVDYDKLFESQAYLKEKSGGEKEAENLKGLLKTRKFLKGKGRYGQLRIRFGEPTYLAKYAKAQGLEKDRIGLRQRIPFLTDLSYHVLNAVNRQVTLSSMNVIAGLLMGNPRRGMSVSNLRALFILTTRFLRKRKVELAFPDKPVAGILGDGLETLEKWGVLVKAEFSGETVLNIPKSKRNEMEYYKNNGLHFILDLCLVSCAFLCLHESERTLKNIFELSREIFGMLRLEFLPQGEFPQPFMVENVLNALEHTHAIKRENAL